VEICADDGTCDTTDADGNYELMLAPGDYLVCEEDVSPPWTQSHPANDFCAGVPGTEPGGHDITLISGQEDEGNDFGNWRPPYKFGYKYEDLDADGDLTDDVVPVNGVTIYLISDNEVVQTAVTGSGTWADGYYEFVDLTPGQDYLVCEQDVSPTWTQSYPPNDDCANVTAVAVENGGWAINLGSGEPDGPNDFGNWRYGYKRGMKFEDLDADGVKDAGEPGVAGV
jgi:hypothetical protein